jgi:hypothetical protein
MRTKQVMYLPVDLIRVATKVCVFYAMFYFFRWAYDHWNKRLSLFAAWFFAVLLFAFLLQGLTASVGEVVHKPVFRFMRQQGG